MYFSEQITGGSKHKNLARDYLLSQEQSLWSQFEPMMNGSDTGDWLWRKPAQSDQPQDIGYAIGARITAAYYDQAENKELAVKEILAVPNYPAFLAKSGFSPH